MDVISWKEFPEVLTQHQSTATSPAATETFLPICLLSYLVRSLTCSVTDLNPFPLIN